MSTSNPEEKEDENCIKIVLCGNMHVGKTTILSVYLNNKFLEDPVSTSTEFSSKKLIRGNKELTLNIWDTAGQEKFYSLNRIFYKGAQIAILVYDITDRDSFEKIKSFWYNEIINYSHHNTIFGIAANKYDLYNEEKVDENEARLFAKNINAVFKLTSAFNNTGITELFDEVCDIYLGDKPKPDYTFHKKIDKGKSFLLKKKKKKTEKEEVKKCC